MNSLKGKISKIEVSGDLSLVSLRVETIDFKSIVIATSDTLDYLIEGGEVKLLFKETEVIIGKAEPLQISLRNKIPGRISKLEVGALLAKVTLDTTIGPIVSIITANAVKSLNLMQDVEVIAMVKTNEILLAKC